MAVGSLLSSPTPRYWPDENGPREEERPIRRWRVLHACDQVREPAALAEAQIRVGMRPSVLTPRGWYRPLGQRPPSKTGLSLVHEWQQVRHWRNRFVHEQVDEWAEILHAHCFAAAMAGLRGRSPVVYDLESPVGANLFPKPGAWLLRSLRVAEQFALGRAAAVVVHAEAMRTAARQRGVRSEDLFLVPEPVEAAEFVCFAGEAREAEVVLFAPVAGQVAGGMDAECVIRAFATLHSEMETARLLMEIIPGQAAKVRKAAADSGVAGAIKVIDPEERERAMAGAEIILAGVPEGEGPNRSMISALAHGRAVVAADVPQNREVTPQGRGCLWCRPNDARDLAGRAAFLARNPDFRSALAISGHVHVQATRGAKVVARKYDEVYRHAFERQRRGGLDPLAKLEIVRACW